MLGSRLECSLLLIGLLYYFICHTSPCIVSMGSPLLPAVFQLLVVFQPFVGTWVVCKVQIEIENCPDDDSKLIGPGFGSP